MLFLSEMTLDLKNSHHLQNGQVTSDREDHTYVPGINKQGRTKPNYFTYFAVVLSVISLTINKPLFEIRLESMQQNQL